MIFFSCSRPCYLLDVYNTCKGMRYSVCLGSFLTAPLKWNQYKNTYSYLEKTKQNKTQHPRNLENFLTLFFLKTNKPKNINNNKNPLDKGIQCYFLLKGKGYLVPSRINSKVCNQLSGASFAAWANSHWSYLLRASVPTLCSHEG